MGFVKVYDIMKEGLSHVNPQCGVGGSKAIASEIGRGQGLLTFVFHTCLGGIKGGGVVYRALKRAVWGGSGCVMEVVCGPSLY